MMEQLQRRLYLQPVVLGMRSKKLGQFCQQKLIRLHDHHILTSVPKILWSDMRIMALAHSFVISRVPYPMECCVSSEKRKMVVKSSTSATHGFQPLMDCRDKTECSKFVFKGANQCQCHLEMDSGCGSVGRALASDTRDPRFESFLRPILFTINVIKIEKMRPGLAHLKKKFQDSVSYKLH